MKKKARIILLLVAAFAAASVIGIQPAAAQDPLPTAGDRRESAICLVIGEMNAAPPWAGAAVPR